MRALEALQHQAVALARPDQWHGGVGGVAVVRQATVLRPDLGNLTHLVNPIEALAEPDQVLVTGDGDGATKSDDVRRPGSG